MRKCRVLLAFLLFGFPLVPLAASVDVGASKPTVLASASPANELVPERIMAEERASRSENIVVTTTSTTAAPTSTTSSTSTTAKPRPKPTTTTAPKAQAATPAPTPIGGSVESVARAQVGKRYVSGGTGPNAFDCSGLVYYVFNQAGISIPRLTSDGYYAKYTKISRSQLQPGDLVVSSGHIGIYVGGGQMVHASTPRGGVKLASMEAPRPVGFVRVS